MRSTTRPSVANPSRKKPARPASGAGRLQPNEHSTGKRRSGAAFNPGVKGMARSSRSDEADSAGSDELLPDSEGATGEKQGYLLKVSDKGGRRNGWQRRWFALQGEILHYYGSHITLKERGAHPFGAGEPFWMVVEIKTRRVGRIYLREVTEICRYVNESIDPRGKRVSRRMPHTQKLPGLSYKDVPFPFPEMLMLPIKTHLMLLQEEIFNVLKIEIADRRQTYYLLASR